MKEWTCQAQQKYYEKNRERIAEQKREYYQRNRERIRKQQNDAYKRKVYERWATSTEEAG